MYPALAFMIMALVAGAILCNIHFGLIGGALMCVVWVFVWSWLVVLVFRN